MLFSFNLWFFRAFFGRKIGCKKFSKSKANPLPKCQFLAKNGHFLKNLFRQKNVSKYLKIKGNSLKYYFLLI